MAVQLRAPTPNGKRVRVGRANAGVEAAYRARLLRLVKQMNRDVLAEVAKHYRAATPQIANDADPDQPRDRWGRWVAEGGNERAELQGKYRKLLDRLEEEDSYRPPYGAASWAMGKNGFDTREHDEIDRPLVLGEISHPDDPSEKVPITLSEGRQKTSKHDGKGHGRRHIEFRHGQEIREAGFEDALDFISHIVSHHNEDIANAQRHSRNLVVREEDKPGLMGVLHMVANTDHYRITTAYPENGTQLTKPKESK